MINVKRCYLTLLFAKHEKHGFNILGESQQEKVPASDKGRLFIVQFHSYDACPRVLKRVSQLMGTNQKIYAQDNLKDVVKSCDVGELERFAVLHESRAGLQNDP